VFFFAFLFIFRERDYEKDILDVCILEEGWMALFRKGFWAFGRDGMARLLS